LYYELKIGGIDMTEDNRVKPNYNNPEYNHEYNPTDSEFENQYGDAPYAPNQYNNRGYTDSFYYENEDSGAGSFLLGAIVGGVIGAAAALFLAPKTGKEMREDLSTQTGHLKDKSIEISTVAKDKASEFGSVAKDKATEFGSVAKDKATEFGSVAKDKATEYSAVAKDKTTEFTASAKDKTDKVTKTIQKQSGQLVDKVKSMTSKKAAPLDDGTAAIEGEELIEFVENLTEDVTEQTEEVITSGSEAIKAAVVKETQTTK